MSFSENFYEGSLRQVIKQSSIGTFAL